jgi:hypothetical protein
VASAKTLVTMLEHAREGLQAVKVEAVKVEGVKVLGVKVVPVKVFDVLD